MFVCVLVFFFLLVCKFSSSVYMYSCSSPERGSLGLRLFTSNQSQSLRREMKSSLSKAVKDLQQEIDSLNRKSKDEEWNKDEMKLIEFLPMCLR